MAAGRAGGYATGVSDTGTSTEPPFDARSSAAGSERASSESGRGPPVGEEAGARGAAATGTLGDARALERLLARPRTRLAHLPTPLVAHPRLARALGLDELYVKADDETGFALGGNKVRKLEYELAPERLAGATCLLTAGGPQSNHCRVTAAFAARHGLDCVLVLNGPEPLVPTGNAFLHRLFGAEIRTVADRSAREDALGAAAAEIDAVGGRSLVVAIGASTGLGSLGYARAAHELAQQLDTLGPRPRRTLVFFASSSCGTLAGLVLGLAIVGRSDIVPIAVSADATVSEIHGRTVEIVADGAALVGTRPPIPEMVGKAPFTALDSEVGEGYGIPTPASLEATSLFARKAGIVLDPTYTAKAAAGMISWIRERGAGPGERVVFLHTGGHPGLLA